jgi:CheY-like chemotaxis protein
VQRRKPDVIISDIGMTGENGYEFIKRIRSLPQDEGGHIPAIALTAYAAPSDRRKALLAGFQTHLAKPIEPAELLAVISSLTFQQEDFS